MGCLWSRMKACHIGCDESGQKSLMSSWQDHWLPDNFSLQTQRQPKQCAQWSTWNCIEVLHCGNSQLNIATNRLSCSHLYQAAISCKCWPAIWACNGHDTILPNWGKKGSEGCVGFNEVPDMWTFRRPACSSTFHIFSSLLYGGTYENHKFCFQIAYFHLMSWLYFQQFHTIFFLSGPRRVNFIWHQDVKNFYDKKCNNLPAKEWCTAPSFVRKWFQ